MSQGEEFCGGAAWVRGAAAAVEERPEGREGGPGSRQRGGGARGDAQCCRGWGLSIAANRLERLTGYGLQWCKGKVVEKGVHYRSANSRID
jgi:hypothetical protein